MKEKLKFFLEFFFVRATVFQRISGFVLYKCQKKTAEILWSSVFLTNLQHDRRNLMNNYIYPIQYLMLRQNKFSLWIILSHFIWNDVMSQKIFYKNIKIMMTTWSLAFWRSVKFLLKFLLYIQWKLNDKKSVLII